jgi:hypothetical protein
MHDLQTQYLLKGIKIVVAVQQLVSNLQTMSANEAIDGLAHGVTTLPEIVVGLCSGDGQIRSASLEYLKLEEFVPNLREKSTVSSHKGKKISMCKYVTIMCMKAK